MNWKLVKTRLFWWVIGVVNGLLMATDLVFARSIDPGKAGVTLWIFLVVGAFIILLQLIPAIILFMSFFGVFHKTIAVNKDVTVKEDTREIVA